MKPPPTPALIEVDPPTNSFATTPYIMRLGNFESFRHQRLYHLHLIFEAGVSNSDQHLLCHMGICQLCILHGVLAHRLADLLGLYCIDFKFDESRIKCAW